MAQFKAIKDGKPIGRKMCKWGDACKYKYKCRLTHPSDLKKEEDERKTTLPVYLGRLVLLFCRDTLNFSVICFRHFVVLLCREFGVDDGDLLVEEEASV
jgi:hypothetical protein